jgi:hypothetical protein
LCDNGGVLVFTGFCVGFQFSCRFGIVALLRMHAFSIHVFKIWFALYTESDSKVFSDFVAFLGVISPSFPTDMVPDAQQLVQQAGLKLLTEV